MTRFRLAVAALCVTARRHGSRHGIADEDDEERGGLGEPLDHRDLDRPRAEAVPGRPRRIREALPERQRQVHVGRRQHADDPLDRDPGRQPARSRVDRSAGPAPGLRQPGARRRSASRATAARNYTADWLTLGTVKGKLYGLFFKGANKSTVWYSTAAFRAAGIRPPATWPAFLRAANTLRASGTRPSRSAAPTAGRSPTCSRTSTSAGRAGELRPAHRSRDPLDASDGEGGAQDDGAGVRLGQHVRRDVGALQTDFPTSVNNVWAKPPKAAMVIEAAFVPASRRRRRPRSRTTTSSSSRRSAPRRPSSAAGDIVVMFKDSAASRALVTYLAGCGGDDRGEVRAGLLVPEQERPRERVLRRTQPRDGDRARAREEVPLRPLRPRAVGVRRHGRAGPVQAVPGLPQEPVERERHRVADGGGGKEGLQVAEGERNRPPRDSPGNREPGRWRRYAVTAGFLAPAAVMLGVWVVYPTIYTAWRSFYDREGDDFVGFDNYQTIFTTDILVVGGQEQRALGARRPRVRDRRRADLRRPDGEDQLVGGLQDRGVHADGDLPVRRPA